MPVKLRHTDKISSVLLLTVAAGVFVVSGDFPRGPSVTGPAFFPRIIAMLIAAFALAQLGKTIYVSNVRSYEITREVAFRVLAALGLVIAYVLALPWVGFIAGTIIFLVVAMWYSGVESLLQATIIAVGVTLGLYYTFIVFLHIPLPEGGFLPIRSFLPGVLGWSLGASSVACSTARRLSSSHSRSRSLSPECSSVS